jgi:hypothetical protein
MKTSFSASGDVSSAVILVAMYSANRESRNVAFRQINYKLFLK